MQNARQTGAVISLSIILGLMMFGCSPKLGDMAVAKLGDERITLAQYENLFIKSNGSKEQAAASTQEEREKFLDLMTNFRLKLKDAYNKGLDKNPEIQREINQYKGSLVQSFLTDRELTTPGTKMMYDGRLVEYRASHILLTLTQGATSEDSAAAYTKAYEIIARLKGGASFASEAEAHSNDPSAAQNKGDLYYFTTGQMVPEFEDAIVKMKVGEITSVPVRTQFGLHVIKLVDRKPAPGEVRCSHIMIRFDRQDPSPEDTLAAYEKIQAIQDSLKSGIDFAELAQRNSGDPGSSYKGGDLDWFSRRRWIQPFDEVALALKPGQTSGIVRTVYGYHLIKCTDARPMKSFEESKKEMQQLYQQTRFQEDYKKYLVNLKKQLHFNLNNDVATEFIAAIDTNKSTRDTTWASGITPQIGSKPMMTFGAKKVTIDSVVTLINERPDMANLPLRAASIHSAIERLVEQLVFQAKGETIQNEYPDFQAIMKEYTDGILLYQVEQDHVWSKVTVSDSALVKFFEANREKFIYPDRTGFSAVYMPTDSLAQLVYDKIVAGKSFEDIIAIDAERMALPTDFKAKFAKGAADVSGTDAKVIKDAASQLRSDAALTLQIIAYADTSSSKSQNRKFAIQRMNAIKSAFVKKHKIAADKITTTMIDFDKKLSTQKQEELAAMATNVDVQIKGKKSWFMGEMDSKLLPITSNDERTTRSYGLPIGSYSVAFRYNNGFSIVRADTKDPSRQKTFEEAGTEVSSLFQEYESKRLEQEWLKKIAGQYPVVKYKDVLKHAFVSDKK